MDHHLHTLTTPSGQVMYTHHELDSIGDGTDRFLSDGYLVARDGSSPVPLPLDDLLQIISAWGSGEMLRVPSVQAPPIERSLDLRDCR